MFSAKRERFFDWPGVVANENYHFHPFSLSIGVDISIKKASTGQFIA